MRVVIACLLSLALAACDRQKAEAPQGGEALAEQGKGSDSQAQATGRLDRSHAGEAAPDILFADPAGEQASIADFKGKPVLVNLWATWCAPCVAEMPTLDALAAREPDLEVLALSQDLNGKDKVDAFFAERKFSMLGPYLDAELAFMTALKIEVLPTTILYDAEGRELWRMTGMEDWTGPRAAALIAEAKR